MIWVKNSGMYYTQKIPYNKSFNPTDEREMTNQELSKWLAIHIMKWSEDPLSPWGQSSDKAPSYVSEEGGMISQADWNPLSNIKHAVMVMRALRKLWRERK